MLVAIYISLSCQDFISKVTGDEKERELFEGWRNTLVEQVPGSGIKCVKQAHKIDKHVKYNG